MKRNWDTIREILIAIENLEPGKQLGLSDFEESQAHEISYHVQLLEDEGLIEVTLLKPLNGPAHFFARNLTLRGHEFLDSIRNDTIWNKIKNKIQSVGGSMTFDLVKSTGKALIKSALENS